MFDRPSTGEKAVLVHLAAHADADDLCELETLASSAGVTAVAAVTDNSRLPSPRYLIRTGKLDEVAQAVQIQDATLVLFNHPLTPSQERNLEQALAVRVVDRTTLILDIFAQRARSFEGKLQVELAQLKHLSSRLVRGWTHLERQKGGIGLRGPGETQLETDRRLIAKRMRQLEKRLERVAKQRQQGRNARRRSEMPVVSLVGYTNAGKSTLFNVLTDAEVWAADQLFATLDPTLRRCRVEEHLPVVIADTVGFIRHLPHELIAAFRSTLSEVAESDLLLHVIDAADERLGDTIAQVNDVLGIIGADRVPCVRVFNKIDRLEGAVARIDRRTEGDLPDVWLSAASGEGLDLLRQTIGEHFIRQPVIQSLYIRPHRGDLRARLFSAARVLKDEVDPATGGWNMEVEISDRDRHLMRELTAESEL